MTKEDQTIKNFPTKEEVLRSIAKLNSYQWPTGKNPENIDQHVKTVTNLLTEEFKTLADYAQELLPSEFNFNIFRVRENSSIRDHNLLGEHSYTPKQLTTGIGRCHFPNYPVFYGSTNASVALVEVIRDTDFTEKSYCISRWEIDKSSKPFIFQPLMFSDIPENSIYKTLQNSLLDKLNNPFNGQLSESQIEAMKLYLNYIGNIFMNDNYFVSACFTHRRFYGNDMPHKSDVIMYPSVQSGKQGVNLAIQPTFVDNRMVLKRLYLVKVKSISLDLGRTDLSFYGYAKIVQGSVKWQNGPNEDFKRAVKEDFDFEFSDEAPVTS